MSPSTSPATENNAGSARGRGAVRFTLGLTAVGAVLSAAALLMESERARFGFAWLWGVTFVWSVVLGNLFFVALQHVTRSVWSVVVRRVAEMFAAPIWVVGLLFVPVPLFTIFFGEFSLFPWADPGIVSGDHVLEGKAPYLNNTFFAIRAAIFFLLWIGFTRFFVGSSVSQDRVGGDDATIRMRRLSAPFLLIFALTVTFASFDWLMSLEPHWFSTIFGVYVFSGMAAASLAAITIAVVWMRSQGKLDRRMVTGDHLYNLGGLIFAFTCFWAYIAFCQFMLIWYGNLPEETVYFAHRAEHGWKTLSVILAVVRFAVPFLLLLSRDAKSSPRILVVASIIVLAGELLDLYWLIMPQIHHEGPILGWQEAGPLLLMSGLIGFYLLRFLRRHDAVAKGDPLFEKSREFHL